ncbi:MAG: phosphotransferase [Gammaproteobacteria bacterium]|nr:phosphotransferase [Gammaproteobacteria bacterium]
MIDKTLLENICTQFDLGNLQHSQQIVSGLTNSVLYLETTLGKFAIKLIHATSQRARQAQDYQQIESLALQMQAHGVPTITAIPNQTGQIAVTMEPYIVLVYPWWPGQPLSGPIGPIPEHFAIPLGTILARMHQASDLQIDALSPIQYTLSTADWQCVFDEGLAQNAPWVAALQTDFIQQLSWVEQCAHAYDKLNKSLIYSHGDFCPHNILFQNNELRIIDWELAGLINPSIEFMLAAIMCSGFATEDHFNPYIFTKMQRAYQGNGCTLNHPENAIWGAIGKGWFAWIYFNLQRSLNEELNREERTSAADNATTALGSLRLLITKTEMLLQLCQSIYQTCAETKTPTFFNHNDVSKQDALETSDEANAQQKIHDTALQLQSIFKQMPDVAEPKTPRHQHDIYAFT